MTRFDFREQFSALMAYENHQISVIIFKFLVLQLSNEKSSDEKQDWLVYYCVC